MQEAHGEGPLLLHLVATVSTDAQGNSAAHYEPVQSWMRVDGETTSPDAAARATRSRTPSRRLRGKTDLNTLESNLSQDAQPRDAAMGGTAPAPADLVGEEVGEDAEGGGPGCMEAAGDC